MPTSTTDLPFYTNKQKRSELPYKLLQADSRNVSTSMKEALLEAGSEVC
jgi:hypothetical protein